MAGTDTGHLFPFSVQHKGDLIVTSFSNIILTTDLSENSEAAAPYALMLAERFSATIHLVYVFEDNTALLVDGSMGFSPIEWLEHTETDRKNRLQMMAA